MESYRIRIRRFSLQILVVLGMYAICRALFIYVYWTQLDLQNFWDTARLFAGGMRFDLSSIAISNGLFLLLTLSPHPFTDHKKFRKLAMFIFLVCNGICLLANMIDLAYFEYIHKRTQADALLFISGEKGSDLYRLLPVFLKRYWYFLFLFLFICWLLWKGYTKTMVAKDQVDRSLKNYAWNSAAFLLAVTLSIIAIRGGLQAKPLDIIHASEMTRVNNIPALLNTPFSIFKTIEKNNIPEKKFFPEETLNEFYNGIQQPDTAFTFDQKNIVIIVVESLSKRYISYFGGKAQTPFLDSLFRESLVFTNAFANAKESVQGIPAIFSSIPSWQADPFIFSSYASNQISSLPNILKQKGYQSFFFHGGFNGTMGFDSYAALAGFDAYLGMNEYDNTEHYDGTWGIWDEEFLQFAAEKMSVAQKPFFSGIFTLNTHNPYVIPNKYKKRFNRYKDPFLNCVTYLDYSLSRFFETIKNEPWFKNTLFVITADHTAPFGDPSGYTMMDDHRIPIVFYQSGTDALKGETKIIANQIDILPSVLDLIHYDQPFFSLGKSLFRPKAGISAINYNGQIYQYIDSTYCYHFNGEKPVGFYEWRKDSLLTNNLYPNKKNAMMLSCDSTLKKNIQFFSQCMIRNKMHVSAMR